jgi:hypothetical protein
VSLSAKSGNGTTLQYGQHAGSSACGIEADETTDISDSTRLTEAV